MDGTRVLVTGGAGFIGSYLTRRLAETGHTVIVYDVREPGPEAAWLLEPVKARVTFVHGSVDNWSRLFHVCREYAPCKVAHIAAIVDPVLLSREPLVALRVNFIGTINVLEAACFFKLDRAVCFSSVGVLPAIQHEPVDAAHPVILPTEGPGSGFYGAAKVSGEVFCFAYRQAFGVDFIVLRPSAVYGLGMQRPLFIQPMVENSLKALPTRFDHGREFPRDYTYIKDVAQLAHKALAVPAERVCDRIFYAATGRPLVTAGAVADTVKRLIPSADIEIAPGLTQEDKLEIRYRGQLSIQNAREQLGYEPEFADIRDGIRDYIAMYRAYAAAQGMTLKA